MTQRWIVGYDFSADAEAALALAAEDLRRLGGELHLVHVYNVPQVPLTYEWSAADALYANSRDLEAALQVDVTRSLEQVVAKVKERWPELNVFAHVRAGTPANALLAESQELGAERIVVGTAGRTGLSHLLLGSVAERVVRQSEIPVVVAKARAEEPEAAKKEGP